MKKYKAIIYDIDGTILDTLEMNIVPLMKIIEEETGKKVAYEELLKYAGAAALCPGCPSGSDMIWSGTYRSAFPRGGRGSHARSHPALWPAGPGRPAQTRKMDILCG